VNRFEVAILRIVIKSQKPLSICSLIEGFPNDYEDFVLQAINNLVKAGYIRHLYVEKMDRITYNTQKRKEILTIIDPLPELEIERQEKRLASKKEIKHVDSITNKKNNDNGRWYYTNNNIQRYVGNSALVMSVMIIGVVSIFSTAIPTADVYQNFRLSERNYYHPNNNHHLLYSPHVIIPENSTKNDNGFYSPEFLKDQDRNPFMTQTSIHRNCVHELSS
jgi:hypothetical protein